MITPCMQGTSYTVCGFFEHHYLLFWMFTFPLYISRASSEKNNF